MERFEFGPGEENVERVLRRVLQVESQLIRLSRRIEIDSFVIAALLASNERADEAQERWRQMVAAYYPQQKLKAVDQELLGAADQELDDRIGFWTQVFEARSRQQGEN